MAPINGLLLLLLACGAISKTACAQLAERPGGAESNPIDSPRDLTGLSIKNPRIRVIHTKDANLRGGSLWLQEKDPWLGYLWGRSLFQREFRQQDGVYSDAGQHDGPLLPDGATHMQTRSHVNSCAACHTTPYRDAGAGGTIAKNGGTGRNTPHLFGGGVIEMLGQHIQKEILRQADEDKNGWISISETWLAENTPKPCTIATSTGPNNPRVELGHFADHNKET